jgi:hypothetical protein
MVRKTMTENMNHNYKLVVYNGRVKIYIDDYVFLSFNQIDFKGYYAFKDDTRLYGIDFYLVSSDSGGSLTMETSYKTKKVWLDILKLLDKEL